MSKPMFFGAALACLSGGMFYGFNRVLREQKVTLSLKSHAAPTAIAGKALAAATLLCFGTVFGGVSFFVAVTGITSASQFGKSTQSLFSKYVESPSLSEEALNDQATTSTMGPEEELDYVTKRYFSGIYEDTPEDAAEFAKQDAIDAIAEAAKQVKVETQEIEKDTQRPSIFARWF